MRLADFALERYFARWEFACKHLLCASDLEGWPMGELLALADEECRVLWDGLRLGYSETAGHPLLRAEIAQRYEGVAPEEVHTFAGAGEAIFAIANVLCGPGDHVIVVHPCYQSLAEVARAAGAEVEALWLRPEDGFRLDVDALARALRPSTRLVVINFPHNPTGALPDRATFEALCRRVETHGAWLLADEVYRGLEVDPADRLPAAADRSPRAISVGAMAKSYGLAGLRVGWIAVHDRELRARIAAFKDYGSICNAAPAEILSLIALRAESAVFARGRAILEPNLALLRRFMDERKDRLDWVPPRGGVTAFPRFRDPRVDVDRFCEDLVRETGVLLLPGSKYEGPAHFRIGFGRSDFAEGLAALGRFLDATRSS